MEMEIVLPSEVPVMTLPETVFFPQALMPLHIFEPRYREMLRNVLATNRLFAVAGLDPLGEPGQEQPHRVATVGIVRACQGNDNGTSNLLLQGLTRVRIISIAQAEPYRRIQVQALASEPGGEPAANRALQSHTRRLIDEKARLGGRVPEDFVRFLATVKDPETFVDLAVFNLCENAGLKQRLLEILDVNRRLRVYNGYLRREVTQLALERRLQGDLPDDYIERN